MIFLYIRPFPVLHGVQVLRVPHRKEIDVAKQLKREGIMVTLGGNSAKRVDQCKMTFNQWMMEFNC